jgi:hypothetical protein
MSKTRLNDSDPPVTAWEKPICENTTVVGPVTLLFKSVDNAPTAAVVLLSVIVTSPPHVPVVSGENAIELIVVGPPNNADE